MASSGGRTIAQAAMEFGPIVRIYESRLWRRNPLVTWRLGISFERELELILAAAELAGAEAVLDLACGPGIYARPLARRVPRGAVVGLDLSLPMLRSAVRRAHEAHLRNLHFLRGSALDLPFSSERFDVVNCCGALHLFPDVPRALREIGRVLRPGGRFTVATFHRPEWAVADLLNAWRRAAIGIDAFTSGGLERALRAAGLDDVRRHHVRRDWQIMSARKPARG